MVRATMVPARSAFEDLKYDIVSLWEDEFPTDSKLNHNAAAISKLGDLDSDLCSQSIRGIGLQQFIHIACLAPTRIESNPSKIIVPPPPRTSLCIFFSSVSHHTDRARDHGLLVCTSLFWRFFWRTKRTASLPFSQSLGCPNAFCSS